MIPSPLVTLDAVAVCPHGGRIAATSRGRVRVGRVPVVTMFDPCLIAGCPFFVGDRPDPCVSVRWVGRTTRVLIGGQPAVLQAGAGIALNAGQVPAGPVTIVGGQTRVAGA
ncbi:hypothetical protein [Sphingomonas alpina]|uniref:PAAR domain-containing protein n=1 Tax=Sphingomonas alpina TaxID=653931 RepID=A0A7H0LKV2_9SPHN|nr:hypothetical protein [Sphingomonas alpina]QNQ10305.1 hypothetical protein H3Z74_03425 [Sphingomonas alpina]